MDKNTQSTLVQVGVGAGVIFVAYKLVENLLGKFKEKTDKYVAAPIADAIVRWTFPAPVTLKGVYILQTNGAVLDPNKIRVEWVKSNAPRAANYNGELPTVMWQGVRYELGQHDAQGNYPLFPMS